MAVDKGWWEDWDLGVTTTDEAAIKILSKLALVHSEVSEAVEDVRNNNWTLGPIVQGWKPEGLPSELADVIIRALDIAGALGIDTERAIRAKVDYNKSRSYKHGGKKA